jgi:phosphopantothenoylcysteine decarboxylase/phosphopantothenate--cysteine ligase
MGYAMASAAKARGAEVTLISGPVSLKSPYGIKTIYVETASEMYECVMKETKWATILVMVAAVADYTPVNVAPLKIEKQDTLTLQLQKTRDILSSVSALKERPFIVGFAAQTGPEIDKARAKLLEKGADVIFFNDLLEPGAGFQSNTNRVIGISKKVATPKEFPLMSKEQLSDCLFDYILEQLG